MVKLFFLVLLFSIIKSNIFITCHLVSLSQKVIDKPIIINVPSVNGEIYRCAVTRSDNDDPHEDKWSIKSTYWSTKLERIGAKNNSCSFKIITAPDGWLGKWIVTTYYKDKTSGLVNLIYLIHKYDIKSSENIIQLH
ncbi:hypothetical protein HCN44_007439 [Aphidius gifuensis]|uniref:Odorant-binding protein n=1 Tax=Aphidius gifuensis TaxID=684658 RepID=A0A835CLT0_APHGI|nr:hypothetical protein HCN44_007439 [Aphidius gifuensis]